MNLKMKASIIFFAVLIAFSCGAQEAGKKAKSDAPAQSKKEAWRTDYKAFLEHIRDHGESPAGLKSATVQWQAVFLGTKPDEHGRLMALFDIKPLAITKDSSVALDFYIADADKSKWVGLPAKTKIEFVGEPNPYMKMAEPIRCGIYDVKFRRVVEHAK